MMFKPYRLWALSAATFLGGANLEAPRFSLLYQFAGGVDGLHPDSSLTLERHALYGATVDGGEVCLCGEVFKLSPPARPGMAWVKTTIFSFSGGAGGESPSANLIFDRDGAIYGTAFNGGLFNAGIVFRLTLPASPTGKWTETVLHNFGGKSDGIEPSGPLIAGPFGALYGTTVFGGRYSKGIAYSLTPPGAGRTEWTETVLHGFAGGSDGAYPVGVIADREGSLYGTTENGGTADNGTVFQLKRQTHSGEWRETIIDRFAGGSDGSTPGAGLTAGAAGILYGTTLSGGDASCTRGCGTVFSVKPDGAGGWDETILYRFTKRGGGFSTADLVLDDSGTLYGTTDGGSGEVFSLAPPLPYEASWRETTLHAFTGGSDGGYPNALFLEKRTGVLYGTTFLGGVSGCEAGSGCGTAFMIQLKK